MKFCAFSKFCGQDAFYVLYFHCVVETYFKVKDYKTCAIEEQIQREEIIDDVRPIRSINRKISGQLCK